MAQKAWQMEWLEQGGLWLWELLLHSLFTPWQIRKQIVGPNGGLSRNPQGPLSVAYILMQASCPPPPQNCTTRWGPETHEPTEDISQSTSNRVSFEEVREVNWRPGFVTHRDFREQWETATAV